MKLMNIIIISFLVILTCCDDNKNDDFSEKAFFGNWELKSLLGGFAPTEIFKENEILWLFNSDKTLKITINKELSDKSRLPIKIDTIVSYSYDTINISIGLYKYEYKFEGKTLKIIDNLASDGIMLEFVKK